MIESRKSLLQLAAQSVIGFPVIFLVAVAPTTAQKSPSSPGGSVLDRQLQSATAHFDAGQYAAAEEELKPLLEKLPGNPQVNELMGLVCAAQGDDQRAEPYLEKAVDLDPKSVASRTNLAANLARLGDNVRAETEFRKAIAIEPDWFAANHGLGEFYAHLGNAAAALPYFRQAQKLEPSNYQNGYDLSQAEIHAGKYDDARRDIQALLAKRDTPELRRLLAETDKHPSDTIEYSDSADLKPGGISGSVDAGGYSSQTQARGSELRQALGTLPPASSGKSDESPADAAESRAFERASALLAAGDYAQAAGAFQQGAAQSPESARMLLGLGVADYSRGLYIQAIDALCEAVDLSPGQPQAYFFLAQAYSASPAKTDDVLKRVADYASSHPGNAAAQYYYAVCLWRSRTEQNPVDPRQVEQLLRSATTLDSSLAEAHFELGVVLADQGQAQQAASEFERAVAVDPQWAEAHYRLGQAYRQEGVSDKARSELEESERLRKSGDTEDQRLRAEVRRFLTPATN